MLAALRQRQPIPYPVALVVAHPDDETIAAGGSLHLMPKLLLVHVTDGAPRNLDDAARKGFPTPDAYAAARAAELDAALALTGTTPVRETLGVPDQQAMLTMPSVAARLRALFRAHGIRAALTHAYEGGHPDHDSTALCVHLAASGGGPAVFEFAGYHEGPDGGLRTGVFLPADTPAIDIALPPADAARKAAMLACFHTQQDILRHFDPATERIRAAPEHDFTEQPHKGRLLYETWGWDITGMTWRKRAAELLEAACAG
ncbi:MAG: hypothetical protein NVSMB18_31830 [Acetobacteraceae bacterium]